LCSWFLRVFKFFFGFLWARRSAWNHALHSFHTALGKIETPFFGAPQKRKRGRGGKERHSSQCRASGLWDCGWGAARRASPQPPRRLTRRRLAVWRGGAGGSRRAVLRRLLEAVGVVSVGPECRLRLSPGSRWSGWASCESEVSDRLGGWRSPKNGVSSLPRTLCGCGGVWGRRLSGSPRSRGEVGGTLPSSWRGFVGG
jgi:hypothetical protein